MYENEEFPSSIQLFDMPLAITSTNNSIAQIQQKYFSLLHVDVCETI